ncbi:protein disulfide-isomerase domain [Helicocarpus griseus UAMH5409]|uniref:Protein disulfide-isomerase domain n=1 Tax=Helicocarpus griseus UAMH5409 TaxID=1447875 RepID=A0A2B7WCE7_9EURO|nr:protein disulfide-isomerase domain [Helicocarpus griseus UAMH5409]
MKASLLTWSLFSLLLNPVFAAPSASSDGAIQAKRLVRREEAEADEPEPAAPEDGPTVFNGIEVPPMKQLDASNFDETIKEGYWFVKHHSPYCPYCVSIAPTWQTLYEFYYTSNPLPTSKQTPDAQSLNSFHGFYNFHFASMDCIANADKCEAIGVEAFPTFTLYHNGEKVENFTGKKKMRGLSKFIENKLEQIKPGSRPRNGLRLPNPGDDKVDTTPLLDGDEPKGKSQASANEPEDKPKPVEIQKPKDSDRPLPNPHGTSLPLTAESFQKLVTTTRDPWFIKFYAPWCTHCQALAPTWQQMAKDMKGVLNVGEVNCDVERRLCKDARVASFPTIHFFRGGERVEYHGLRGLGDLVSYAKKAVDVVGRGVQYVDAAAFKEMEETEEVIFLYFFDQATTSEDFAALDRLTLSLVGHARLVKTDSEILAKRFRISTWPRLLVSRDGRPSYYNALAPKDMRDFRQVLTWMESVWLPIVPELTASNAREVLEGKYVVLGILNRLRSDEFIQDKKELKNAALEWMEKQTKLFQLERQELRDAKELRIEEAEDRNDQRALRAAKNARITIREDDKKQVGFAWVDGIFWDRWLRTTYGIDVRNGERVIINDEENRRYWDTTTSGAYIMPSRTSILETITHVVSGSSKLKAKSTVGFFEGAFFNTRSFTVSHPYLSVAIVLGVLLFALLGVRGKLRRNRGTGGLLGAVTGSSGGGFFHLDGKEGLLGGGNGSGKVD